MTHFGTLFFGGCGGGGIVALKYGQVTADDSISMT